MFATYEGKYKNGRIVFVNGPPKALRDSHVLITIFPEKKDIKAKNKPLEALKLLQNLILTKVPRSFSLYEELISERRKEAQLE